MMQFKTYSSIYKGHISLTSTHLISIALTLQVGEITVIMIYGYVILCLNESVIHANQVRLKQRINKVLSDYPLILILDEAHY